jgi:glycosyltransferase involved in cell wall biosynthesis
LKIIRVTGRFGDDGTGPSKNQYLLSKGLVERGHEVSVYTYASPHEEAKIYEEQGIIVRKYPYLRLRHMMLSRQMVSDILKEDADIIHTHGYRNFQTDLGALASMVKKRPLIITTHGSLFAFVYLTDSPFLRMPQHMYDGFTFKASLRQASFIIAASKFEEQEALTFGLSPEKIRVIHHGIDPPPFVREKGGEAANERCKRLLMVTRITYKNNLEFLLSAFAEIRKEQPEAQLRVVGPYIPSSQIGLEKWYPSFILRLSRQLGIDSSCFVGPIYGDDLWKEYLSCDLFLWTSRYDNFGHALLEAAICGKPVVSTPVGIAPELIGQNEGGILVPHNDVESMKNAVFELLTNRGFYERASNHLIKKSREFTVDAMVSKYERVYQEALDTTRASR